MQLRNVKLLFILLLALLQYHSEGIAKEIITLKKIWEYKADTEIASFDLSKNGQYLAAATLGEVGKDGMFHNGAIIYFNIYNGNILWKHVAKIRFFLPEVSMDGNYILTSALTEYDTGKLFLFNKNGDIVLSGLESGAFKMSEDGSFILAIPSKEYSSSEDYISLINIQGKVIWKQKLNNSSGDAIISPDGKHLIISDVGGEKIYNIKEGKNYKINTEFSHRFYIASFTPDKKYIILKCDVLDWHGKLIRKFETDFDVQGTEVSKDNKYLLCNGSSEIALYEMNGKLVWQRNFEHVSNCFLASKRGFVTALEEGDKNSHIYFLDMKTGKKVKSINLPEKQSHLRLSYDERFLAVSSGKKLLFYEIVAK